MLWSSNRYDKALLFEKWINRDLQIILFIAHFDDREIYCFGSSLAFRLDVFLVPTIQLSILYYTSSIHLSIPILYTIGYHSLCVIYLSNKIQGSRLILFKRVCPVLVLQIYVSLILYQCHISIYLPVYQSAFLKICL